MQTLDVISVNIWQIIISLLNLLILFTIIKKFLYKPVNKVLKERQEEIEEQYSSAELAEKQAAENKEAWEEKLENAKETADDIVRTAKDNADMRSDKIIAEAKAEAEGIIRRAKEQAELEKKKAEDEIKHEIIGVSALLAEKMLDREINIDDHHALIDSFIEEMGDKDGGNE